MPASSRKAKTPRIKIRRLSERDIEPLYKLYSLQEKLIPHQPKTRFKQFAQDLTTSRMYPDKSHYDAKADIAIVAECEGQVVAYANGCKVVDAKGLVRSGQAFIRFILADRQYPTAARQVIRKVVNHLKRFNPDTIKAFNSYITPVFLGFAGGLLPSGWGWLGQCLVQEGFESERVGLRMLRDLKGRGNKPKPIPFPQDMEFFSTDFYRGNGMQGLERKYCLREFFDEIAVCENYYSGAYVRGSGYQYLFTLWLCVMPEYRGKGYSRMFVRNALVSAHKAGSKAAMLMTAADNFVAQDLYRSEGYRTVDTVCSFSLKEES